MNKDGSRNGFGWIGVFLAGLLLVQGRAALAFPEFPTADFMHVQIVADAVEFNGVPMRLFAFSSERSEQDLLGFYRKVWGEEFADTEFGPQRILAHRKDDYLLVVQILERDALGSRGTLSIAPLFSRKLRPGEHLGAGFPLMPGSMVVSDIHAQDAGKASRTLVVSSKKSLPQTIAFYRQRFLQEGWQPLIIGGQELGEARGGQQALVLNRAGEELNLAFSRVEDETFTVAVLVRQ